MTLSAAPMRTCLERFAASLSAGLVLSLAVNEVAVLTGARTIMTTVGQNATAFSLTFKTFRI
jgi:hypothetical protein